ncbi:MAG: Ig-like domain-containing protein [Planctomycetes bacterium]|nr:Ig-like domain-containing protein [Planctomycetota bacterium]
MPTSGFHISAEPSFAEMAAMQTLAAGGSSGCDICDGTNLIKNASCEAAGEPPPDWTEVSGDWKRQEGGEGRFPDAKDRDYIFWAGSVVEGELKQDVDVTTLAAEIDAGRVGFKFSGWLQSFDQDPPDKGRIIVEYRSGGDVVLATFDTLARSDLSWTLYRDLRIAPIGTRTVRIRLFAYRASGTANDGYIDDLYLRCYCYDLCALGNLLYNPSCEATGGPPPPGWIQVSGQWQQKQGSGPAEGQFPLAKDGDNFFYAGNSMGEVELRQDVDVTSLAARIDLGMAKFTMDGWLRGYAHENDDDSSRLVVEYRSAAGAVLAQYDTGPQDHDTWTQYTDVRFAPAQTRTVRVRLLANRMKEGTEQAPKPNNDGYFDHLSLSVDCTVRGKLEADPNPACIDDAVTLSATLVKADGSAEVGKTVTFRVDGASIGDATTNAQGLATRSYTPTTTGTKTVTATAAGYADLGPLSLLVVKVDKIIVDGSSPEEEGPVDICLGASVTLRANRDPSPATGPWPPSEPVWEVTTKPTGSSPTLEADPSDPGKFTVISDKTGDYVIKASCGTSDDTFSITVSALLVITVTADEGYEKVGDTWVLNVVGPLKDAGTNVELTITIDPNTQANRDALTWEGATVVTGVPDSEKNLKATVPVDVSVRKTVVVKHNLHPCREIRVWPVWARIGGFRGENAQGQAVSPENNAAALPFLCPGLGIPATCAAGTFNNCEIRASISPSGVSALEGVQFDFKRRMDRRIFEKNVDDETWAADELEEDLDDDSSNEDEDLHDANDVIWVNDTPGVLGTAVVETDFAAIEWNFREHVDLILNQVPNTTTPMSGLRVSRDLDWHSILNVRKSSTGNWIRNDSRKNRIGEGAITIGTQPQ